VTAWLDALAARQWRDYRSRQPGTCFADPDFALDLPAAYALQAAVAALRIADGDRVAGYKVGCTGPGTIAQFGMAGPVRGFLYASELHPNGTTLPAAAFAHLAVEGEMALRIGPDGEIAAAFPVIELHHFVFRAPRKTLPELVANNGLNAGAVLADAAWQSSRAALAPGATLSVHINDRRYGPAGPWPLPGGPAASLAWLRPHLAAAGLALRAGDIVLAGTPLGLYPVTAGDRVAVCLDAAVVTRCTVG
jgi:2-keto-4-pentenoate hydratase